MPPFFPVRSLMAGLAGTSSTFVGMVMAGSANVGFDCEPRFARVRWEYFHLLCS
jgi:hypothetical protein